MKFIDTNGDSHDTRVDMYISNIATWIVDKLSNNKKSSDDKFEVFDDFEEDQADTEEPIVLEVYHEDV
jgi:hypothetical protein